MLFENRNIPTKFRNCIKEILPLKESVPISVTTNIGNIKNTKNANSPCTFFTNIAKNLKCETFKLRDLICEKPPTHKKNHTTTKSFNFRCVSRIFVERELISLKHRKADGCDNLPPGILKDAAYSLSSPLTHLINLSLSTGLVPNKWKIAKVTPIFKKGNTNDCNNYLQISVLNTCSKILKRAVHKQLIVHLEINDLLSKTQFGYRKNRSTELATRLLCDNIRKAIDENNIVGMLYVDLSKVFNT